MGRFRKVAIETDNHDNSPATIAIVVALLLMIIAGPAAVWQLRRFGLPARKRRGVCEAGKGLAATGLKVVCLLRLLQLK